MIPGAPFFHRRAGELWIENLPLEAVAAQYGTPCYVYSRAALEAAYAVFESALRGHTHLVCYAVKANSNLAILNLFARLGSGFDIVSGGELARVIAAGGRADRIVFSGVGKSETEIRAALVAGIMCFNIESEPELERINLIAGTLGVKAPVSIRVNPDVDARTHAHISTGKKENKFGIPLDRVIPSYQRAAALPHIAIAGIDCHIGSQVTDPAPLYDSMDRILALTDELRALGIPLKHISNGGSIGIRYKDETPMDIGAYLKGLIAKIGNRELELLLEPGRSLVGNAGVLLSRIEYLKQADAKRFAVIDAAMNDLARPAMYDAWHEIVAVRQRDEQRLAYEIVGPVCESTDKFGQDRQLAVHQGDLLAILSAGAYGMAMASNYNSRPRPAEVLVDGASSHLIRSRETLSDLFAHEKTITSRA
jgi:diaminopimelate decarboxylase